MDNFNIDIKTLDIETGEKILPAWELKYQKDNIEIENLEIQLRERKEALKSLEIKKLKLQNSFKKNKEIIDVLNDREKEVLQNLQKISIAYPIYKAKTEQFQNYLEEKMLVLKKKIKEPTELDYTAMIQKLNEENQIITLHIKKNNEFINSFIKKYVSG